MAWVIPIVTTIMGAVAAKKQQDSALREQRKQQDAAKRQAMVASVGGGGQIAELSSGDAITQFADLLDPQLFTKSWGGRRMSDYGIGA